MAWKIRHAEETKHHDESAVAGSRDWVVPEGVFQWRHAFQRTGMFGLVAAAPGLPPARCQFAGVSCRTLIRESVSAGAAESAGA